MKINICDTLKEILKLESNEIDDNYIKNRYINLDLDFKKYRIDQEVFSDIDKILEINNNIEVRISNCTLKDEDVNLKNVKKIAFENCSIYNLNIVKGAENLKEIVIENNSNDINFEKMKEKKEDILTKYPNFNEKNIYQKIEILKEFDCINRKKLELKELSNFENLEILSINDEKSEYLSDNLIDNISSIKNLKELFISEIDDINLEKLSNLKKLESLYLNFNEKNYDEHYQFLDSIKEFKNLKEIALSGIDLSNFNVEIPKDIESINFTNCNISKVNSDFFEYEKLKRLCLDENRLEKDVLQELYDLKKRGINTSIKRTPLAEHLRGENVVFDLPELETKLKKILGISNNKKMTQYEIFNNVLENLKLDITEILELQDKGIYEKITNDFTKNKVEINQHEPITQEVIDYFMSNEIEYLEINDPTAITDQLLEVLKNKKDIKIRIKDDLKEAYNLSELKLVRDKMLEIKEELNKKDTDIQKTFEAYKILGKNIEYDHSGCIGKENYVEGRECITRSLYGSLVEKKAVCYGFALTFEKVLNSSGIVARMVGGYAHDDPRRCHAWNQVYIDNIWYNNDLTWDNRRLKKDDYELNYFLKSDKDFVGHTPSDYKVVEKCDFSYDTSKLYPVENNLEELKEQVQDPISGQINEKNIYEINEKEKDDEFLI